MQSTTFSCEAAIIGAGPAGLMAAESLASEGISVHVFDAMPSVGRKFLLAGKGGLNLTHSEPFDLFASRFGNHPPDLTPALQQFGPEQVCTWAQGLGVDTFVGTSGRVFPTDMKAAPLLRAWLHRLRGLGVQFHMRHHWTGWNGTAQLQFSAPNGTVVASAKAVVLALGGASWARLGSDGAWVPWLAAKNITVAPLRPSNCGFDVLHHSVAGTETRREFLRELIGQNPATGWTPHFATRFAGQPFKAIALSFTNSAGQNFSRRGEFVATATGIEGSLVYAASALLRDEIETHRSATLTLDLLPDHSPERVLAEVCHPRGTRTLSSHLKSRLGLDGIKMGILYEQLGKDGTHNPLALAEAIKALPLTLVATRPLDEAISTAGGVAFSSLNAKMMLRKMPGVFCAGEMLDWEAPTGGYLITASLATGLCAAQGAIDWIQNTAHSV